MNYLLQYSRRTFSSNVTIKELTRIFSKMLIELNLSLVTIKTKK